MIFFKRLTYSIFFIACGTLIFSSCNDVTSTHTEKEQTVNWSSAADSSTQALIDNYWYASEKYFKTDNQGDNHFQYWPQAHALDVLVKAYLRTNESQYSQYIQQWYEGVQAHTGGDFKNVFNDDMEWNGLAMLRAYDAVGDQQFKTAGRSLWEEVKSDWTADVAGGGIMWQDGTPNFKNAPANGPACILAAKLYQMDQNQEDLDWAKKIYDWEKNTLRNNSSGAVWDGVRVEGGSQNVSKNLFTYNQGTFIGAALKLYEITGQDLYLHDAVKTTDYTLNSLTNANDQLLQDEGNGDGGLFKGIFIRYFAELIQEPDLSDAVRKRYIAFMRLNARTLWLKGTNKNYVIFGSYWKTKPGNTVDLKTDLSGAILIENAALLDSKGMLELNSSE